MAATTEPEAVVSPKDEPLPESTSSSGVLEYLPLADKPADSIINNADTRAICRQVEYYFSDENLRHDDYLLKCMRDNDQQAVSLSRIISFNRMKQWKPKSRIVAALKQSSKLDLIENNKLVKRKVPFIHPDAALGDSKDVDDDSVDGGVANAAKPKLTPGPSLPQKKKELPPGVTKNMLKPTGFEDNYAEGPVKPEEASVDQQLYDPDKPFIERIELAIQRFKQKRRMHEMYSRVFGKFMLYGGVESGPRMFGAKPSPAEMKEMEAEELTRALATHHVPWSRQDEQQWVVDFDGVAKGFLSSYYPANFGTHSPKQIHTACQTLRSFFNFLVMKSVCPEYNDSILRARSICDLAEVELIKAYNVGLLLPGKFNMAASALYGGSHTDQYSSATASWKSETVEKEDTTIWPTVPTASLFSGEAPAILALGLISYFPQLVQQVANRNLQSALRKAFTERINLEVTTITPPSDAVCQLYRSNPFKYKAALQPLGLLHCKPWSAPGFQTWDLPAGMTNGDVAPAFEEYIFFLEEEVLSQCFEGMKFEGTVMCLEGEGMGGENGDKLKIMVLDSVSEVHVSFFEYLPNELVVNGHAKEIVKLKKTAEGEEGEEKDNGKGKDEEGNEEEELSDLD